MNENTPIFYNSEHTVRIACSTSDYGDRLSRLWMALVSNATKANMCDAMNICCPKKSGIFQIISRTNFMMDYHHGRIHETTNHFCPRIRISPWWQSHIMNEYEWCGPFPHLLCILHKVCVQDYSKNSTLLRQPQAQESIKIQPAATIIKERE
jgi:hypothetical protein